MKKPRNGRGGSLETYQRKRNEDMVAAKTVTRKPVAEIVIRYRYFVKRTGSVVLDIQSGPAQYRVCLNVNGTATCSCEGNAKFHKCCKHIKAMWRKEASREQVQEPATVPVVEVMAAAQKEMVAFDRDQDPNAYDVLAATKRSTQDVTRCRHCNKPSRSGLCYQCNEY